MRVTVIVPIVFALALSLRLIFTIGISHRKYNVHLPYSQNEPQSRIICKHVLGSISVCYHSPNKALEFLHHLETLNMKLDFSTFVNHKIIH